MSKSNKTTKVVTFLGFAFDDERVGQITPDNTGECVGVMTSCGLVSGTNSFASPSPGDRVVLRKGAGKSWGDSPWVMTGPA